jgi:hypothetical protein
LLEDFEPYFVNQTELNSLKNMPVFINNPKLDTLLGTQSEILFNQIQSTNNQSVLFSPPISTGVALHSGVGSNVRNTQNVIQWIKQLQL